jgi:hypothetical protein
VESMTLICKYPSSPPDTFWSTHERAANTKGILTVTDIFRVRRF